MLAPVSTGQGAKSSSTGLGPGRSPARQDRPETQRPTAEPGGPISWPSIADLWPWLTGALLLAWIATLWLWRRDRQSPTSHKTRVQEAPAEPEEPEALSVRAARNALDQACRADDPRAARDAVLAWATAVWHDNAPSTLVELAERFKNPRAHEAIALLDRAIYTRNEAGWNGRRFWEAVSPVLKKPAKPRKKSGQHPLPELSPRL